MGFYSDYVFPRVLDRVMQREPLAEQRPIVLSKVKGPAVLEIGFGTGLNLPHYPNHIRRLAVLEPNGHSLRRSARRIESRGLDVTPIRAINKERVFDAADASFDTVVSTWTLCTIPDVDHALREVHRVLKRGGQFLFIEHGLAPDPHVARWQHRLNPINRWIGDGCNLNRDIHQLLRASPLTLRECDRFYLRDTLRVGGYMYRGVAER